MPSYVTPKRATAFSFQVALVDQSNLKLFKSSPTLAAGDVTVQKDGGTPANITSLPTATGAVLTVNLSASEMNADNVAVLFSDQADSEWCDRLVTIQTTNQQVDDLASQASLTTGISDISNAITVNKGVLDIIRAKTDNLPEGMQRAQPLPNFTFFMASSTDHVTGVSALTVSAEVSLDGTAFVACANAPTELSDGLYVIDLEAADTDGDIVTLRFTAVGADATVLTVKTVL